MGRKANDKRPAELRRAILQYLVDHGLADLSLRPLAKAVGSSPRVLLYYFGSKERMVIQVLGDLRNRQREAYERISRGTFAEEYRAVWAHMTSPASEPLFRLFFEVYGVALRHPRRYKAFLQTTVEDWLQAIAEPLSRAGHSPGEARAFATVVLAGMRGFMLDYCTSRDRKRLDRAVALWLLHLDSVLAAQKRA